MTTAPIRITRKELYELVWSTPMSILAKQFCLSDVGLAKICKKYNIPRPARGYWQKLQHGQKVKRAPLPSAKNSEPDEIIISRTEDKENDVDTDKDQQKEAEKLIDFEKDPKNEIRVFESLVEPIRFIEQMESHLANSNVDEKGYLVPRAKLHVDIQVTPASKIRALCIMDALIKALESRGFTIRIANDGQSRTIVQLIGEELQICLGEKLLRKKAEVSPDKLSKEGSDNWAYLLPRYDYTPTGILLLKILATGFYGVRKSWEDGKLRNLEEQLNSVVIGLLKAAVQKRTERIRQERYQHEREQYEKERIENLRRQWEEEKRLTDLLEASSQWHKSQQLRAYIKAFREIAIKKEGEILPGSQMDQWIQWAMRKAEEMDPLS